MNVTEPGADEGITFAVNVTLCPKIGSAGSRLVSVVVVEVWVNVNVAIQLRAMDSVTMPSLQSTLPLHPAKNDPAAGVPVSVTTCPKANGALQVLPQLIPAGLLVIVPLPAPSLLNDRVFGNSELKVAMQLRPVDIVTLPSVQSESPVHPAKEDPALAVAVRTTACPVTKDPLQVAPQEIPDGLLVTVPLPVPLLLTVRAWVVPLVPRNTFTT